MGRDHFSALYRCCHPLDASVHHSLLFVTLWIMLLNFLNFLNFDPLTASEIHRFMSDQIDMRWNEFHQGPPRSLQRSLTNLHSILRQPDVRLWFALTLPCHFFSSFSSLSSFWYILISDKASEFNPWMYGDECNYDFDPSEYWSEYSTARETTKALMTLIRLDLWLRYMTVEEARTFYAIVGNRWNKYANTASRCQCSVRLPKCTMEKAQLWQRVASWTRHIDMAYRAQRAAQRAAEWLKPLCFCGGQDGDYGLLGWQLRQTGSHVCSQRPNPRSRLHWLCAAWRNAWRYRPRPGRAEDSWR